MANELVPMPGRRADDHAAPNGHSNGQKSPTEHQVFDPLVAAGYVDTDEETAGEQWNLPPTGDPREAFETARNARHHARRADEDAEHARQHGRPGFAALRESDADDNRQSGWGDWGDFRTWAIIAAMFVGFLLVVALVYFSPTGRHNQNDGPLSVPPARLY